jgi:hypothetical protein
MALLKNNHTIAATFLTAILAMVVLLSSPSYIARGEKGFTCAFHFFFTWIVFGRLSFRPCESIYSHLT